MTRLWLPVIAFLVSHNVYDGQSLQEFDFITMDSLRAESTEDPITEQSTILDQPEATTIGPLMDQAPTTESIDKMTTEKVEDQTAPVDPLMDEVALDPGNKQGMCYPHRPGEMDFETIDLIMLYKLDRLKDDGTRMPGVRMVQGSSGLQRAYRIGKEVNLTMPLQKILPRGLPEHFSLESTFNARRHRGRWSVISARSRTLELAVTLVPRLKMIVVNVHGQRAVFHSEALFSPEWHKIHVAIMNESIHVAVDCFELKPVKMARHNFSNVTSISILSSEDGSPANIDLQWLSLSCSPYVLRNDSCEELEPGFLIATSTTELPPQVGPTSMPDEASFGLSGTYERRPSYVNRDLNYTSRRDLYEDECNITCPPGPIGPTGPQGVQGPRGFTGLPGVRGIQGPIGLTGAPGFKGERGPPGEPGSFFNESMGVSRGLAGPPGLPGRKGQKGEPGELGLPGLFGNDGKDGEPGPEGPPGPRGERGPQGPPGPQGLPGTAANFNSSFVEGAKGQKGAPGRHGRDGRPGERGPRGQDGTPGVPGPPGPIGVPGVPGERGLTGPQGPQGERGLDGSQGPEGPRGHPGPPGPPGSTSVSRGVDVVEGPPGPRGFKGEKGEAGMPGMPGKNGVDGIPGLPGPAGAPGAPAPLSLIQQTPSITENEVRNICSDLISERLRDLQTTNSASTPPTITVVKRGPRGYPGPPGVPGLPGDSGEIGPRGYQGEAGEPGSPGSPGPRGDKGDKGERGPEGVGLPGPEGPRGIIGPIGPPGSEGKTGARGDPGREGPIGPRGVPGPRGSCDCPTAAYYSYLPTGNQKGP